jgi:type II secretory pathway component PulM
MKVGVYIEMVLAGAAVIAILLAIGYLIVWKTTKNNAGVRRTEYSRMRKHRDEAVEAVNKIDDLVAKHVQDMLDTPLNADIRQVLREYNKKRLAAEKEGT